MGDTPTDKVSLKKRRDLSKWYPVAIMFLCGVLATFFNVAYTLRIDHESDKQNEKNDRKWCTLLIELDDAYQSGPPPTTEIGRRVAAAVHDLRVDLGC